MIKKLVENFFQMIDINDEAGADPFRREEDHAIDGRELGLDHGLSVQG